MKGWFTVASATEIAPGSMAEGQAGGERVALYNIDGAYYCTSNICTHAYAHLTDGYLEGKVIECPLHAGQFDVTTGKGLGAPITCDIKTFPIRVVGEEIQVYVGEALAPVAA